MVIVGSILLALGVEAWWDRAQEQARASALLVALATDATANLEDAERAIAGSERSATRASLARELLDSGWEDVPRDSVIALVARSGSITVLLQRTGTYDQLVTTLSANLGESRNE